MKRKLKQRLERNLEIASFMGVESCTDRNDLELGTISGHKGNQKDGYDSTKPGTDEKKQSHPSDGTQFITALRTCCGSLPSEKDKQPAVTVLANFHGVKAPSKPLKLSK